MTAPRVGSQWGPGTLAAAATSSALIAHQVAAKAVRDALFLSSFAVRWLPVVMAVAALISVVSVLGLSRSMQRFSPTQIMPFSCAASALALVLAWALGLALPRVSAVAVYLHTTALGPALISLFWSLVNERFDPYSAKPAVARIAAGGTLGGVLGALAAWLAASWVELPALILCLAALHAACAVTTHSLRAPVAAGKVALPAQPPVLAELRMLPRSPLLRQLGLLVALGAATTALLDYVFSARAAAAFGSGPALLSFFALFWLVVSVLSFLLQVTLGRLALRKLGLAANIALLPAVTLLGSAFALVSPGLASVAILRGAESAHHHAHFRSAYEVFYTPLTEAQKRATKAIIDVGVDRLGTVLGSAIAFLVVALAAPRASLIVLVVVVVLALLTLPVARRLHAAYLGALEEGMREGARELHLPPIRAGSGRPALDSKESAARDILIGHVEAIRPGRLGELGATNTRSPARACDALSDPERLIADVRDLLSGDVDRNRRVLGAWPASGEPVAGLAILLLSHEKLHRDASQALRRAAPAITGQLVDALLDPAMDFVVRRRLPRILAVAASQRAADGLVAGMRDARFEVRYECGRALMTLTHQRTDIVLPRERIIAAILSEREKTSTPEDGISIDASGEGDPESALVDLLVRDRIDRSLEHAFTLLSLYLEREPLRMAFRALHQEDVRHRGTALEYLATILSAEVRAAVWPLLGEALPLPPARPAREILADLVHAESRRSPC